ncbi:MAG TPA: hypothetical protein VFA18_02410 [Gemmataceae bacterium]|nr:hypothetical protein [Gemmataceae bacterium]
MANERLIHDVAFATSRHILELFAGCIREDEQRDAFAEIYERVKAGIEAFEIHSNRMEERLHPGRN